MTDREEITIQGLDFSFIPRYSAGHVLTENEASALNQVLGENLRNNFASKVRKAKEEAGEGNTPDTDALQEELDAYAAEYQFGVRKAAAPKDPVEAKARSMARAAISAALRAGGQKVKDFTDEAFANAIDTVMASEKGDEFRQMARMRIEEEKAAANISLAGILTKAA